MQRYVTVVLIASWACLGASQTHASDDKQARERARSAFQELLDTTKDNIYHNYKIWNTLRRHPIRRSADARRPTALAPENGEFVSSRASAAIRTGVEDTEAGLVISPFVDSPESGLRGLSFFVAALADDETRFGASWVIESAPRQDFKSLGLDCSPGTLDEWGKTIDALEQAFVEVCGAVVARWPEPPVAGMEGRTATLLEKLNKERESDKKGPLGTWYRARLACGLELPVFDRATGLHLEGPGAGLELSRALGYLSLFKTFAEKEEKKDESLQTLPREHGPSFETLDAYRPPQPTSCVTSRSLKSAIAREDWNHVRTRLRLGAHADLFPRKGGFSPDDSPLPRGERKAWLARADLGVDLRRLHVAFGMGIGGTRKKPTDEFDRILSPSFSVSWAAFNLSAKSLTTPVTEGPHAHAQAPNLDEAGNLPPHVVLGLDLNAAVALDRPEIQTTAFNTVKILPYVDFKISGTLSFRLGVPITALLVERKADTEKDLAARSSLQWTFPVSIVTVLKL